MNRILSVYVNCSLGGMTTVYRTRTLRQPGVHFDHVFQVDRGGIASFEAMANASVRITDPARLPSYLNYALASIDFEDIRVTSLPGLFAQLTVPDSTKSIYEIHSPMQGVIRREIERLGADNVDEVWVPSDWSADIVEHFLPAGGRTTIRVVPNLIDEEAFSMNARGISPLGIGKGLPVSWIGRLENSQKNYLDFLRMLRLLPEEFYGLVIYSFEDDPGRLERFLGDAAMLGVERRIRVYSDVPQREVAKIHRAVRDAGGVFCSTALSESFGYAVLEASLCGCPVVTYDVGPLRQHSNSQISYVPVGDLPAFAESVIAAAGSSRALITESIPADTAG